MVSMPIAETTSSRFQMGFIFLISCLALHCMEMNGGLPFRDLSRHGVTSILLLMGHVGTSSRCNGNDDETVSPGTNKGN